MMMEGRFGSDDPDDTISNLRSEKTVKNTKYCVDILRQFCAAKGKSPQFEENPTMDLNFLLKEFYTNMRKHGGDYYKLGSFMTIRHAINRHLKEPPYNKTFDILKDQEFNDANLAFKGMCKRLRAVGKGKTQHKTVIAKGDVQKLYEHPAVFNVNAPVGLLNKVWFETLLHFCRRGQENLRDMKPSDFEVRTDDRGLKYVSKVSDFTHLFKIKQGREVTPA